MKRTIATALAAFALSTTAQADTFFSYSSDDYCQALAGTAAAAAELRDTGFEFSYAQAAVADARDEMRAGNDGDIAWIDDWIDAYITDNFKVVELVYAFPRVSPNEEGNAVYNLCRED